MKKYLVINSQWQPCIIAHTEHQAFAWIESESAKMKFDGSPYTDRFMTVIEVEELPQ